nr:heparinase II/III family protein [uncultured Pseudomonas sp.]
MDMKPTLFGLISLLLCSQIIQAAQSPLAPVLFEPGASPLPAEQALAYPLFAAELQRTHAAVDRALGEAIAVPEPTDPGGGPSHEQHKRNYRMLYDAGLLYRISGERAYAEYVRDLLLAYADLYPKLGPHPAAASNSPGRLFWQSLNDAVWLVYAIQAYDAIRATLSPAQRQLLETRLFRPMADFLSSGQPQTFALIHNHATWAAAAVGMTGYVLDEPKYVQRALLGLAGDGKSGFLRQLDLLFSPDGYYTEGPYYQRYALLPFVVFAHAIELNEPQRKIFSYRDGILLKAIDSSIQLTYNGYFFPLNDALPDKSLRTDELYQAVAIGYGQSHDPGLLAIARWQGRTLLTPQGLQLARDLAAGLERPFPFASRLLRDGANGDQGAIAILRSGEQTLVAKNSAQGMGHGHFDKLNWLLYDNGQALIRDYGAARFLNIEAKDGGRYLAENDSWAKQSVAHNTLVVNESSHFDGDWQLGQTQAPRQLAFVDKQDSRVSTAEMIGAYPGVGFRRSLVQLDIDGDGGPLVLDLLRIEGEQPAQYDLPLHYAGHLIEVNFPLQSHTTNRPLLGQANGYQHLWVDAVGQPTPQHSSLTWMNDKRFYSYHMLLSENAQIILAESGANDPHFNLRREPVVIQRLTEASDATFVSLLEPHGHYDPDAESVSASRSQLKTLGHTRLTDAELIDIEWLDGKRLVLVMADDTDPSLVHRIRYQGKSLQWSGHLGRFDGAGTGAALSASARP